MHMLMNIEVFVKNIIEPLNLDYNANIKYFNLIKC